MFQREDFMFHLAHFHARDRAARLVKQINDCAGEAADKNDEEAKGADEDSLCFWDCAKAAEHNLQNFFTKTNSSETDGQCGDSAFHWHHSKEVDYWHPRAQRVSGTEKRRERGKMCYQRRPERNERRAPMMCVKMLGGRNFDQFVATRERLWQ